MLQEPILQLPVLYCNKRDRRVSTPSSGCGVRGLTTYQLVTREVSEQEPEDRCEIVAEKEIEDRAPDRTGSGGVVREEGDDDRLRFTVETYDHRKSHESIQVSREGVERQGGMEGQTRK